MTPLFDSQDYYKKMLELQEKLRKSEEERIRLEERFNLLEQESRIRHDACINKLRMRYIEFLEEQRLRDERNNKLLGALDRVDSSLALMTAKTDKLCSLRKEYEASMLRAYISRRRAGSVTGDSGIVSQNDERKARKYAQSSPSFPSASNTSLYTSNLPARRHEYPSTSNFFSKPLSYPQRPTIDYPEPLSTRPIRDVATTWGYNSTPRLGVSTYPNDSDAFRRTPRFLSKDNSPFQYPASIRSPKTTKLTSLLTNPNLEEEKSGSVLENELDQYINKIRSLHGDLDPSIEEVDHEQNTSGDLLNVTLSEDGTDHLSAGENPKKQVPQEITQVLQIAEDLASRTIEENVEYLPEGDTNALKTLNNRDLAPTNALKTLNDHDLSPINEKQLETQQSDEIESIAKQIPEIEQPEPATKIITTIKSDVISAPVQLNTQESQDENAKDSLNVGKEVDDNFQVVEELAPWSTDNLIAHVEPQVFINQEANPVESKNVLKISDAAETNLVDKVEVVNDKEGDEVVQENVNRPNEKERQEPSQLKENDETVYATDYQNTTGEQDDQNYQDPNAGYDYSNQGNNYQYPADGYQYNQDYTYDANQPQGAENYDPTVQYPENYQQDPNAQYHPENYPSNVQYQSENYQDPNAQYSNENYPQEGAPEYQYQEYNTENYEYNYEQGEGYQGETYQEYPTDTPEVEEQAKNEQSQIPTVESSVKEQDQVTEKKKKKDIIKSILESETESSIEKNTSNTESDFDFN